MTDAISREGHIEKARQYLEFFTNATSGSPENWLTWMRKELDAAGVDIKALFPDDARSADEINAHLNSLLPEKFIGEARKWLNCYLSDSLPAAPEDILKWTYDNLEKANADIKVLFPDDERSADEINTYLNSLLPTKFIGEAKKWLGYYTNDSVSTDPEFTLEHVYKNLSKAKADIKVLFPGDERSVDELLLT